MKRDSITWTEEKVVHLNRLIDLKLSDEDIATRLHVSTKAIQSKRGKLGIPSNTHLTKRYRIAWTPDQIAQFKQLVKEGMSDRDIADIFGVTRNSIIGKRHRLKLFVSNDTTHHVKATKSPVKPVKTVKNIQVALSGPEVSTGKHSPPGVGNHPEHPESSLAILPGPQGTCKFPFGGVQTKDLTWCGDPIQHNSSYCPEHHRKCHAPMRTNIIKSAGITRWR